MAVRSAGPCVGREVGSRKLDQRSLVVGRELEELDELELLVVEDHPDDGDLVLHGGHQLEAG